ncbi:MAG: hypothetical protein LBU07_05500 [Coriobacteriales bacterium]|nr:hypothetical protein [Coriobacteriales bacterium]
MANRTDIVIVDEEFSRRGVELASHRDFFAEVLQEYIAILDYLAQQLKGSTAQQIRSLAGKLRSFSGRIIQEGGNYQKDCNDFLARIDEADRFFRS